MAIEPVVNGEMEFSEISPLVMESISSKKRVIPAVGCWKMPTETYGRLLPAMKPWGSWLIGQTTREGG